MKVAIISGLSLAVSLGFAEPVHYSATNLWMAEIGVCNQSSPSQDTNGVLYVTSWNGRLHAINSDGSHRWTFNSRFETVSSPAIGDDGTIYFGSRDHRIYAIDRQGRKKWDFKTRGWVDASAAVGSDGTIYVGSWDKIFYALNQNGEKLWGFNTAGPIVSSAALDAAGSIYFGSHDRKFYALSPNGSKRWELATGGAIISSPAVGNEETIYFTSLDGKLWAVNPTGAVLWKYQTGSTTASSPVIGPEGEIFVAGNQFCFVVNPNGTMRWQWPISRGDPEPLTQASCVALANGNVVVVPGRGEMVELSGGKDWIWSYWLGGESFSSPLVGVGGTIYAMGMAAHLHAVSGNVPLARTSWPMFRGNPQRTGRVSAGK
ncbi:MAG TPA: PQQ-binding-like beta-propeller repeat protein [Verrucomicrobiae bacterium]|nr:PQQ-binding-like beta-propeller repeat protein [Verrucomicrobiae bacterium]